MTQETLQRAKKLEAEMELLAEDADNCQSFIDDPDGQDYFISFGLVMVVGHCPAMDIRHTGRHRTVSSHRIQGVHSSQVLTSVRNKSVKSE